MSSTEIAWLKRLVYLDKVNLETLAWFFDEAEAEVIQSWFERDGSIRDPRGNAFKVREVVRKQVVRYLSVRDPREHQRTVETIKAKLAAEAASDGAMPPAP